MAIAAIGQTTGYTVSTETVRMDKSICKSNVSFFGKDFGGFS